ncbi:MAG: hypothetical protein M1600_10615 [Firmicutes bacterium]|jgi:hypothetical protein|nr:hypothetical protein [Bacillota bacterium]
MGELTPSNVVRNFVRIQDHFSNLRGNEQAMTTAFRCLEEQLAWYVKNERVHSDDEILQALAASGLLAYDRWSEQAPHSWERLPDVVQQLAGDLTRCFDPETNPEILQAALLSWGDAYAECARAHFYKWGGVIRRLMDSVRRHQKRGPRGYSRFVVGFVSQFSAIDDHPVHWVLVLPSTPEGLLD